MPEPLLEAQAIQGGKFNQETGTLLIMINQTILLLFTRSLSRRQSPTIPIVLVG
jgi:hypothetical protein